MERFEVESTKKTPQILLDPDGTFKISGRSIHEDPSKFYDPLVKWINEYCSNPKNVTTIEIKLEYFNSGSAKYILNILQILSQLINMGFRLVVNWYYEEGDDDILERGEYYASILDTNFNFIEFE
ncbi:MAG: DUF1987 domain-containing protein [Bacteroidales bacterium]|nr:MAG: DUF1987 domain-containing protein [Bacteroidales bacterium]